MSAILQPTIASLLSALKLPNVNWKNHEPLTDSITVYKTACCAQPLITHSLTVNSDLSWKLCVHGHVLNHESTCLSQFPEKLNETTMNQLICMVDKPAVCPGNPDKNYIDMAVSKGKLPSIDGKKKVAVVDSYSPEWRVLPIRTAACKILLSGERSKCCECVSYRNTLRKSFHRWTKKKTTPSRHLCTTSHTNLCFLSTPERLKRYRNLKICSETTKES